MRFSALLACFWLAEIASAANSADNNLEDDIQAQMNGTGRALSRKKRYLVFPEGSSLQLVFCLTVPTIGRSGLWLTIGGTAAMAWELPTDPEEIKKYLKKGLKGKGKGDDHKDDKHVDLHYHHDDDDDDASYSHPDHRVDWFQPSKKKSPIIYSNNKRTKKPQTYASSGKKTHLRNPFLFDKAASAAYSTIQKLLKRPAGYSGIQYRGGSSPAGKRRKADSLKEAARATTNSRLSEPITTYLHPVYQQIHRRTRRDLYGKIEKLFRARNKDGRACLLKAICEVGRAPGSLGSFAEEILKAIFRPKPSHQHEDEDDYDRAFTGKHNCTEQYPTCNVSVFDVIM